MKKRYGCSLTQLFALANATKLFLLFLTCLLFASSSFDSSYKVSGLVDCVKKESENVEREAASLRALQNQIKTDPLMSVSNFRDQPLPKKAALVAALLFFVRGGADGLSALNDPGLLVFTVAFHVKILESLCYCN